MTSEQQWGRGVNRPMYKSIQAQWANCYGYDTNTGMGQKTSTIGCVRAHRHVHGTCDAHLSSHHGLPLRAHSDRHAMAVHKKKRMMVTDLHARTSAEFRGTQGSARVLERQGGRLP